MNSLDPLKSELQRIFGISKVVNINVMDGKIHSFVLLSDFTKLHGITTANNETKNTTWFGYIVSPTTTTR